MVHDTINDGPTACLDHAREARWLMMVDSDVFYSKWAECFRCRQRSSSVVALQLQLPTARARGWPQIPAQVFFFHFLQPGSFGVLAAEAEASSAVGGRR